jgi:hypothetical protein
MLLQSMQVYVLCWAVCKNLLPIHGNCKAASVGSVLPLQTHCTALAYRECEAFLETSYLNNHTVTVHQQLLTGLVASTDRMAAAMATARSINYFRVTPGSEAPGHAVPAAVRRALPSQLKPKPRAGLAPVQTSASLRPRTAISYQLAEALSWAHNLAVGEGSSEESLECLPSVFACLYLSSDGPPL